VRGVILVSLENDSFHMVHVYTINWFKKVQNINNYCSHAEQPTFNCHKKMLSYEAWTDGRTAVCHNKPVF
jgi:hypothetical protein